MYTFSELDAMDDDRLKQVAESLGLKKIDLAQKQDLLYNILDEQAIHGVSEKLAEQKRRSEKSADEPKKRGRKKKEATADAPAEDKAAKATRTSKKTAKAQDAPAADTPAEAQVDAPAAQEVAQPVEQPAPQTAAKAEQPAKRRRGRPSKKALEAAKAAEVSENSEISERPGNSEDSENSDVAETPQPSEAPEPAKSQPAHFGEQTPDEDFSSFFPRGEGRKFVPRSRQDKERGQQPRQPQSQQQPQQPMQPALITIVEPGQPQPQQQFQGKKKKFKNNQQPVDMRLNPNQRYDFEDILHVQGVLEIEPQGHGFLRSSDFNYMPSPDDVLVTQQQIKANGLRAGDVVEAMVRAPRESEKYFPLSRVLSVNGRSLDFIRDRVSFEHLVPLFPDEKFDLTGGTTCNLSTRVVDMFAPIGKGQRALIVAPPKTGKTLLLKDIANAIAENHPETYIMILLIDERPEEVTDMNRSVNAEVIASTFDEPADRHVRIAGIVLEKAKRMVECGHDVVILLDSITRLARAYNTVSPASGKILSGGVDANALQKPKRFFGAARNIEGGGSLTIIATALTETSSKMDEVIFEEFKGTGNMELQLDRKLSNKRIFPAVDIMASSTRRDDLLLREETLNRMWILRRFLSDRNSIEAMEFIKERMERTRDNDELLRTMGD